VFKILDFSKVSGVSLQTICCQLRRYSWHNRPTYRPCPEDLVIPNSLPVELLMPLRILVVAFQESKIYDSHSALYTRALHFRNQGSPNDWVWVEPGSEKMQVVLRGHLPAKLVALFTIRDYTCENTVL